MTIRKLIRPTLGRTLGLDQRSRRPRRSPPSPEMTQAETSYLHQAIENGATIVAMLHGGGEIRGRLDFYDRDCLKLLPPTGTPILLRKDQVKYYWAERG